MGRPLGSKNKPKAEKAKKPRRIEQPGLKISDDFDDEIAFLSNPKLKKAGVPIEFTPNQIQEIAKCAVDPIYFINKYIKIITADEGLVTIQLRPYQEDIIKDYKDNRYVICKLPRQTGKTTCTTGFILWYVLFQQHKTVGILAQKEKIANEILTRIKLAYENLPMFIQQGVMEWNKSTIAMENGCRIICETTSSGSIRGFMINLLYLDEFAHVPSNVAEEFFTSVWPTISSGKTSQMIITSTPNGMNMFYKFWQDAVKQNKKPEEWNGFVAKEVHYSVVPGRDEEWAAQQRRILGERKFAQEVLCIGKDTIIKIRSKTTGEIIEDTIGNIAMMLYYANSPELNNIMNARKLWENQFGPIPVDMEGRTYEIHHKDGNHSNNVIENLECITIEQHFIRHMERNEPWAAGLIAKRMALPINYLSELQRGVPKTPETKSKISETKIKRRAEALAKGESYGLMPGMVKRTEEQKKKWSEKRRGKRHSSKLDGLDVCRIRSDYENNMEVPGMESIGKNGKNGILINYQRLFCKHYGPLYNVTPACIHRIINNETWSENVTSIK